MQAAVRSPTAALGSTALLEPRDVDLCCAVPRPAGQRALDALLAPSAARAERARPVASSFDDFVLRAIDRRRHHLREELPLVQELSVKVARRHAPQAPSLLAVREVVAEFVPLLDEHLVRGEWSSVPCARGARGRVPADLAGPTLASEAERERVLILLERLRSLTGGFSPPSWACLGLRQLYALLGEIEEETYEELRLERRLLAPGRR